LSQFKFVPLLYYAPVIGASGSQRLVCEHLDNLFSLLGLRTKVNFAEAVSLQLTADSEAHRHEITFSIN